MPYEYVYIPAEIFLDYKEIIVYHAYKDGDFDRPMSFWYDLDPDNGGEFDIRDLPNYSKERTHEEILKEAIDIGELEQ